MRPQRSRRRNVSTQARKSGGARAVRARSTWQEAAPHQPILVFPHSAKVLSSNLSVRLQGCPAEIADPRRPWGGHAQWGRARQYLSRSAGEGSLLLIR